MGIDLARLTQHDYRIIVEQAPIMIWRADVQAKCDYFNDRWLAFTGRSMAQEIGDGWATGVHLDDRACCVRTFLDAFARRDVFEMEYRLRRYDGVYRWVFDRGGPVTDTSGQFCGYVGSCIDVTERVAAQATLARQHLIQLTALSGLLPVCAWCKKVRDEHGAWLSLEDFVRQHVDANITHVMCPDCQWRHGPTESLE